VKRNTFIFLSVVLLSLLAVPATNIFTAPSRETIKWGEKSFLYNMDFISRWAALLLYPVGISTDSNQVIIGRDDWLFLGDLYEETRTIDRRPPSAADYVSGQEIGSAIESWNRYLSSKGVKLFRIMIGPNKGTIYPENLPIWAKPSIPNATDALLVGANTIHYVDFRSILLKSKASHSVALYYKTDTHWNALGAGIAFQAFAQQVGKVVPEIQWPPQKIYKLNRVDSRVGGDLANFLRLTTYLPDLEPVTYISSLAVETTQLDYDTGFILRQGGNPQVNAPNKPLLVQSCGALNQKKVLWLRDSFGTVMSPFMAATFSEVLQLHWAEAMKPGGKFVQLVEEWEPDYVFFTVVERASRSPWFASYPPPVLVPLGSKFKPIQTTTAVGLNHLLQGTTTNEFQIIGNDPFFDFTVSEIIKPKEVDYLSISLSCADGSQSVPLQLFWLVDKQPYFDEEHSARFLFRTGENLIDLHTLPKWDSAKSITRVRVDIDTQDSCVHFKLGNPIFGVE